MGIDNVGLSGLEHAYNHYLKGPTVDVLRYRDARGNFIFLNSTSARPEQAGHNVILTIDKVLQELAEQTLAKWARAAAATRGFAIVADPHTGRILALANYPSFNPNAYSKLDLNRTRNSATKLLFEPGSITKPLVISYALEEGETTRSEIHNCEKDGRYEISKGLYIHDEHPQEFMTTAEILIHSSNICTAKVAQRLGPQQTFLALKKFGLSRKNPFVPGTAAGRLSEWKTWQPIQLANIAFGQGFLVNGLDIVQAYSVFANGGYLVTPYLLERVESSTGKTVKSSESGERKPILSPSTAAAMKGF